ncbi:MAG: hypothetical protein ACREQ5_35315, partial [Candidatus Dormibacteria bacterium]
PTPNTNTEPHKDAPWRVLVDLAVGLDRRYEEASSAGPGGSGAQMFDTKKPSKELIMPFILF